MELDNLYSFFPKSCGLSEPEYWSLLLIHDGVETQSRISEQLFMSRQTLNSAFKQLVKKGLIVLEPSGDRLVEEQVTRMHRIEEQAWEKFSQEESEALARLTRKYTDVLGEILEPLKKGSDFKSKTV